MPVWKPPYKIRRSTNILSYAIRNNHSALEIMGEKCYLLKRMARANAPIVQEPNRRVSTITQIASSYSTDPDTGDLRYKLWGRSTHDIEEYPDIGVFTCTVAASASTDVWEYAIDKYSFISSRQEYAFDIYQDSIDSDGNSIEDSIYIVFNTGPMAANNIATMTYGIINPLAKFEGLQPIRDDETHFKRSLFGFEQWLNSNSVIRRRSTPHCFLLAFPSVPTDIKVTSGGFLQFSEISHWCNPPMYGRIAYPDVSEMDVIVRASTGERFQVIDYTPEYIEDILVCQHFNLAELDPRSSLYSIDIQTT